MTTTQININSAAHRLDTQRPTAQPQPRPVQTWRADALERAGELAQSGYYRASAEMARIARGEGN